MPSLPSLLASLLTHATIGLLVFALKRPADTTVQTRTELLKQLLPATVLQPPERPPEQSQPKRPAVTPPKEPAVKPRPTPDAPTPASLTAPPPPDPAAKPNNSPPLQNAAAAQNPETAKFSPTAPTNQTRTIRYSGVRSQNRTPSPDPRPQAIPDLDLPQTRLGNMRSPGPFGQTTHDDPNTGLEAPRLEIVFEPGVQDHLLKTGLALLIAELPGEQARYLRLQGTLQQPAGWTVAGNDRLERMSQRRIQLREADVAAARKELGTLLRSAAEQQDTPLKMWFSNEFDQYLLMQQLQAVQHLPESQRNRQTTEIRLYCKGQDIACQTTIRNP